MAVIFSPPLSFWWRVHQPGSTLYTVFPRLALLSVGPTLTTKSSWQVKLNSREIYQFSRNTYLGGTDNEIFFDDILEFDPLTGKWKEVARMMEKRGLHALSTIQFESGFCGFNSGSLLSGSVLVFLPGLMAKWFYWGKVGIGLFWNWTKKMLSNRFSVKTFSMCSKWLSLLV